MTGGGAGRRFALHPIVRWVLVVLIVGLPTAYVAAGLVQNALDDDSGSGSSEPVPSSSEQQGSPTPSLPSEPAVSEPDPSPPAPTSTSCRTTPRLVDREATPEATCLARQLDDWSDGDRYGLGQQLNVSSADYLRPVTRLGQATRPALVGFDLDELVAGQSYGFATPPLDGLLRLAQGGAVLTASWHAPNPGTGGSSSDRSWQRVEQLLQPGSPAYRRFWSAYDDVLDLLERLQTGDGGRFAPAAVLFRPLHEANGDWFWWAQGVAPTVYRDLYAMLQARAAEAGVHNVVWGWSANVRDGDHISDPLPLMPDRLDLAGIDVYEPMAGRGVPDRQLDLSGLTEVASRAPRVAITEAGPHGSRDGTWDPAVPASSAVAAGVRPAYVLFWFDDGNARDGYSGKKQLASLTGTRALLRGCDGGTCPLP